jgi:hypothetical protein
MFPRTVNTPVPATGAALQLESTVNVRESTTVTVNTPLMGLENVPPLTPAIRIRAPLVSPWDCTVVTEQGLAAAMLETARVGLKLMAPTLTEKVFPETA